MLRFSVTGLAAVVLASLVCSAPAAAAEFAPAEAPGPALSVTPKQLSDALLCSAGVDHSSRPVVLLFQGTGATAHDNWSWTYEPGLDMEGIPWCAVDLPDHATGDVQRAGEYVVAAIRAIHARSGHSVSIIGHSQGGMVPRWALRFWPDTRALVDDVIGFAPSNHGTTQAKCSADAPCSAAGWQQGDKANFIRALNSSAETWKGIDYTVAYTRTDETVQPNLDETGSSSLRTGAGRIRNVLTQSICPNDTNEHLMIGTIDPVAYALAIDALTHPGPADPARLNPVDICGRPYHRGVNSLTVGADASAAVASFEGYKAATVPAEPALRCYVTASCPGGSAGSSAGGGKARACASRRRFVVRLPALRALRVTLAGKRLATRRARGRRVATVELRTRPRTTVILRITGRSASGRRVVQVRRYRTCG
jgi:pimeloyl-ACP methyl ester carboxylesterase